MTKEEAKQIITNHLLSNKNFYADYIVEALNKLVEDDEPYWHTEEPTENGSYLCYCKLAKADSYSSLHYCSVMEFHHQAFHEPFVGETVIAWHKIPPYEEKK